MKPTTDTSTLAKNPAYLEYPADILNNEIFMQMNMSQRGIFWTMRMYCWKNGDIPAHRAGLAKLLGISTTALNKLLDNGMILSFFPETDDGYRLYCHDLEVYRKMLIDKKIKRIENGKKAAAKQMRDRLNGNAIPDEMGSDMNRTAYDVDENMNGYLTRQLN